MIHDCDLCGSPESIEVPHCREYTKGQAIDICARCGFVFVRERRTAKEIADTWSFQLYGDGYTARWPAVKARHAYVAEFLDIHQPLAGKRVCDIGAGEGTFLQMLRGKPYGARVFGVEPSPANGARMAKAKIAHFVGTIEEYRASRRGSSAGSGAASGSGSHFETSSETCKEPEERFDVVTILWTLENCQSSRAMLDAAHDLLVEGGTVAVATGSRVLVPFKKPLHYYLGDNPADTHAFRFSAATLQGLLAVSGFETIETNRYLDSDVLCLVGRRIDRSKKIEWKGDDPRAVADFFRRWHVETRDHYANA